MLAHLPRLRLVGRPHFQVETKLVDLPVELLALLLVPLVELAVLAAALAVPVVWPVELVVELVRLAAVLPETVLGLVQLLQQIPRRRLGFPPRTLGPLLRALESQAGFRLTLEPVALLSEGFPEHPEPVGFALPPAGPVDSALVLGFLGQARQVLEQAVDFVILDPLGQPLPVQPARYSRLFRKALVTPVHYQAVPHGGQPDQCPERHRKRFHRSLVAVLELG